MPSSVSHAIAAIAIGKTYTRRQLPVRFWLLSAVCAIAPDVDVICTRFGIDYAASLGHRGFTHSFLFAALLSSTVVLGVFRKPINGLSRKSLFVYFFLVTASHAVFDALVDGALGVAFFAPFITDRFFLPLRPIRSSPVGWEFFSVAGATVIMNEFFWIWLPSLAVILAPWLGRIIAARPPKVTRPPLRRQPAVAVSCLTSEPDRSSDDAVSN